MEALITPALIDAVFSAFGLAGAVLIFVIYSYMSDKKHSPKPETDEWRNEVTRTLARLQARVDILWSDRNRD